MQSIMESTKAKVWNIIFNRIYQLSFQDSIFHGTLLKIVELPNILNLKKDWNCAKKSSFTIFIVKLTLYCQQERLYKKHGSKRKNSIKVEKSYLLKNTASGKSIYMKLKAKMIKMDKSNLLFLLTEIKCIEYKLSQ